VGTGAIHDGVLAALREWSAEGGGLGLRGLGGAGGGAYGGGHGGGRRSRGGVGPTTIGWSAGGSTPQERAAFIRHTAASLDIDPDIALRVAQSEGFYTFTGDHGMSHGDFQLYDGGGLGNVFRRLHPGIDPADPRNWKIADEFALKWAAKHGWGDWHGAAHAGIGRMQGIGTYHGAIPPLLGGAAVKDAGSRIPALYGPPPAIVDRIKKSLANDQRHSRHGRPSDDWPPGYGRPVERDPRPDIHTHIHIDGEKIAHVVTRHQTKHAWAPRQAPYHNRYAHPTSPDIGYETG
jgi:hypothetical protein